MSAPRCHRQPGALCVTQRCAFALSRCTLATVRGVSDNSAQCPVSVMFAYRVHDGRKRIRPNPPPQYPPPRVPELRDLHLYVSPPRDHLSGLSSPVRDDGMPVGRVLFPPSQLSQWYSDACRAPKHRSRRTYGDLRCGLGLHLPLCLVPGLSLADRPLARTRSSPAGLVRARSRGACFPSY